MSEEESNILVVTSLEDRLNQNNRLHRTISDRIETFDRELLSGNAELNKRQFHKKAHDIRSSCLTSLRLGSDTVLRLNNPLPTNTRALFVELIEYVDRVDNLLGFLDYSYEQITGIIQIITQKEIFEFYERQYSKLTENMRLLSEDPKEFYARLLKEIDLEYLAKIGSEMQILIQNSGNSHFKTIASLVYSEVEKSIKFMQSTLSGEKDVDYYDVSYLINQNIQSAEQLLRQSNINVNTYLAPNINRINIDQFDFDRVFFNLLNNAIKYSRTKDEDLKKSKEIDIFAFITVKKQRDYLTILVVDSGIGINDEEVSKIFNYRYMILDERISQNLSRTGVGLNNVHEILEELDGEAFYINRQKLSQETKGSIFGIRIPYQRYQTSIFNEM